MKRPGTESPAHVECFQKGCQYSVAFEQATEISRLRAHLENIRDRARGRHPLFESLATDALNGGGILSAQKDGTLRLHERPKHG